MGLYFSKSERRNEVTEKSTMSNKENNRKNLTGSASVMSKIGGKQTCQFANDSGYQSFASLSSPQKASGSTPNWSLQAYKIPRKTDKSGVLTTQKHPSYSGVYGFQTYSETKNDISRGSTGPSSTATPSCSQQLNVSANDCYYGLFGVQSPIKSTPTSTAVIANTSVSYQSNAQANRIFGSSSTHSPPIHPVVSDYYAQHSATKCSTPKSTAVSTHHSKSPTASCLNPQSSAVSSVNPLLPNSITHSIQPSYVHYAQPAAPLSSPAQTSSNVPVYNGQHSATKCSTPKSTAVSAHHAKSPTASCLNPQSSTVSSVNPLLPNSITHSIQPSYVHYAQPAVPLSSPAQTSSNVPVYNGQPSGSNYAHFDDSSHEFRNRSLSFCSPSNAYSPIPPSLKDVKKKYYKRSIPYWNETLRRPYKIPSLYKGFFPNPDIRCSEKWDEWADNYHPMWEYYREHLYEICRPGLIDPEVNIAEFISSEWETDGGIDVSRNLTRFSKRAPEQRNAWAAGDKNAPPRKFLRLANSDSNYIKKPDKDEAIQIMLQDVLNGKASSRKRPHSMIDSNAKEEARDPKIRKIESDTNLADCRLCHGFCHCRPPYESLMQGYVRVLRLQDNSLQDFVSRILFKYGKKMRLTNKNIETSFHRIMHSAHETFKVIEDYQPLPPGNMMTEQRALELVSVEMNQWKYKELYKDPCAKVSEDYEAEEPDWTEDLLDYW